MPKKILICLVITLILPFTSGCRKSHSVMAEDYSPHGNRATATVKLAAVGDIMMHMPQIRAGYNSHTKKYDFSPFFKDISPYLNEADLALANLETPLAGKEKGFSGYPLFNCPEELAFALKEAGFDLVTTANNHCLDRGSAGIVQTINNLEKAGLSHTGTFRTVEEKKAITIKTVNGINLAFLAYTYGTNGILLPKNMEYMVNMIDTERIVQDILQAKSSEADFIILLLHFGNEYQREPSSSQKELVQKLFSAGADIVLGSHPHVLQPLERQTIINPPERQRDVLVAYSLGNFFSNQRQQYCDSGIILNILLEKNLRTGEKCIKEVSYLPTWVHRYHKEGKSQYRILSAEKALYDYESGRDPLLSPEDYARLQQVCEETVQQLGSID